MQDRQTSYNFLFVGTWTSCHHKEKKPAHKVSFSTNTYNATQKKHASTVGATTLPLADN
jgi:hypothetical protein